ncbi:hypothetical protein [Pseudomonas sp. NPDC090208]|uniref:hypothetical protein n=1 Tax=Pseudomonas sp. NPDC090208 TaxID=3364478 RepID=UPI0038032CE2
MAAMLADVSNQVEVTTGETFLKARDVTVLADASVKGVLPVGTPCIASINVQNVGTTVVSILAGRVLQDQSGRMWIVSVGATNIMPSESRTITARQVELRTLTHTVTQNMPFYTIDLAAPAVGYIAEIAVAGWEYTPEFCNVMAGELIYHIRTDENQVLSIQFGVNGLAGTQPVIGQQITLSIYDTEGDISPTLGMGFTFEYSVATENVVMSLASVEQTGAAPMDINTMREVCSYPGIYSENAVFLSNFDYLVRKKISPVTFLSIWNEAREEEVRGPDILNVNRLFVAVLKEGTVQQALQDQITAIIKKADNSYRLRFVPVVEVELSMSLTLTVPSTVDAAAVRQAVVSQVLQNYGRSSAWAKRGEAKILNKDLYDLFKKNVPELTQRVADITINSIGTDTDLLPEHFRYVTEQSLTVLTVGAK